MATMSHRMPKNTVIDLERWYTARTRKKNKNEVDIASVTPHVPSNATSSSQCPVGMTDWPIRSEI